LRYEFEQQRFILKAKHMNGVLKLNGAKGFSLLAGINRAVVPSQVTKLAESIKSMGVIRPVVVADLNFSGLSQGTYVIDGQHLYHACIRLNIDVEYKKIIINSHQELVEKIALLNSSSKSWTMDDYISAWASLRPDYRRLLDIHSTYAIDAETCAAVLSNTVTGGNRNALRRGSFKIVDEAENIKLVERLAEVLRIVNRKDFYRKRDVTRSFCALYKEMSQNYEHALFIEFLKNNVHRLASLEGQAGVDTVLKQFKEKNAAKYTKGKQ
jgi:hypothetical protein